MSDLIETLRAELATELARDATTARKGKKDSPLKERARAMAAEVKSKDAAEELRMAQAEIDEREETVYQQRVGRLTELWALRANAQHRRAKYQGKNGQPLAGKESLHALALADLENYRLEISTIYGMPIEPYDLAGNGRFMRSIRYHITVTGSGVQQGRKVGMLAMDDEDILMRGIELCYLEPERLVETVRFAADGTAHKVMLPSIGDLYRKVKKAHYLEISRFREALKGRIAFTSLDELLEAGVEPSTLGEGSFFDHYGYGYVDTDELPWQELKAISDLPVSMRAALAESTRREAKAREVAESAQRHARAVRLATVAASAMPLGVSARDKQRERTYRTVLKLVVAGMTLSMVGKELGVSEATVKKNLLSLSVAPSGIGYASLVAA